MIEYVIKEDGTLLRRDLSESRLELSAASMSVLNAGMYFKLPNVMRMKGVGSVGVALTSKTTIWTIKLDALTLHTYWAKDGDQVYPDFLGEGSLMQLDWPVPPGIGLTVVLLVEANRDGFGRHWLFALDDRLATWRLPLSNLYDNCELCPGNQGQISSTCVEDHVARALSNLRASRWNSDLHSDPAKTRAFFRLRMAEGKWTVVPPPGDWRDLCNKVSNDDSKYIAL